MLGLLAQGLIARAAADHSAKAFAAELAKIQGAPLPTPQPVAPKPDEIKLSGWQVFLVLFAASSCIVGLMMANTKLPDRTPQPAAPAAVAVPYVEPYVAPRPEPAAKPLPRRLPAGTPIPGIRGRCELVLQYDDGATVCADLASNPRWRE